MMFRAQFCIFPLATKLVLVKLNAAGLSGHWTASRPGGIPALFSGMPAAPASAGSRVRGDRRTKGRIQNETKSLVWKKMQCDRWKFNFYTLQELFKSTNTGQGTAGWVAIFGKEPGNCHVSQTELRSVMSSCWCEKRNIVLGQIPEKWLERCMKSPLSSTSNGKVSPACCSWLGHHRNWL